MSTARSNNPVPSACLHCDGTEFHRIEGDVTQEFRGDTLTVKVPVLRCDRCGWQTLPPGQLDTLRVRTADAYRRKHALLTSSEIRARREALGMSQRRFAEFVGVGAASIPRWESWQVQEPVYDAKIRQCTDRVAVMRTVLAELFLTQRWESATSAKLRVAFGDTWNDVLTIGPRNWLPTEERVLPALAQELERLRRLRVSEWRLPTKPAEKTSAEKGTIPDVERGRHRGPNYDADLCLTA